LWVSSAKYAVSGKEHSMSVLSTGSWIVSVMGILATPAYAIPAGDDDAPPARSPAANAPVASPPSTGPYGGPPTVEHRPRPVTFLLRTQADFGGDDLFSGQTTNGDSVSVPAGTGLTLAAGLIFQPDIPLAIELTAGYKLRILSASNGTVTFSRFPIDAIASFAPGHHRLGLGVTVHLSPSLDCSVSGICEANVPFDTAVGLILQWAYTLGRLDFGARATFLSYSVPGNSSFSGDTLGFFIGARL
jgi:hypothetical protein